MDDAEPGKLIRRAAQALRRREELIEQTRKLVNRSRELLEENQSPGRVPSRKRRQRV